MNIYIFGALLVIVYLIAKKRPSSKMIEYVNQLVKIYNLKPPKNYKTDFWTCRRFLNKHGHYQLPDKK